MDIKINNKGQAMLWVIIAIAAIAVILLILILSNKTISPVSGELNFQSKIESCIKEAALEASEIMIPQGGFLQPENYRRYNGVNATFLCENIGYYKPCINQHPLYITEVKEELYNYILPISENCFDTALEDLSQKGYTVSSKDINLSVELSNNLILIDIYKEINIEKADSIQKFSKFDIRVNSPIYDLAKVANEIVNQEAKYCYFEYLGYSILYPEFSIRRFVYSDATEIYTITHKETQKEMNIALRGCAIPPGI